MKQILASMPRLGFGLMRLPQRAGAQVDMAQVNQMVDRLMANGFTYFDTAWGYLNGMSEVAAREVLVSRYPRESFQLADKFPIWVCETRSDVRAIFGTQLARTGAQYFDFYLAHAMNAAYAKKMDELGVWTFLREMKEQGLIRHIGFSFHDKVECLRDILDAHPEVEFVQLQINFADWESPAVQSRLCYEECEKRGLPVIVMEPVKGGLLAGLPDEARLILEAERPDDSSAAWALRYAASLPNVSVVLSGMSNLMQVEDNMRAMTQFEPLNERERGVIDRVVAVLDAIPTIGCTGCGYCLTGCPASIRIPDIIDAYNNSLIYGPTPVVKGLYSFATHKVKPSECIACGACEQTCPQHLSIIDALSRAQEVFK